MSRPPRSRPQPSAPLVLSLRPVGDHAALRRAAAAQGLRALALSPWRIAPREDAGTRAALAEALEADAVIASSPAAARCAALLSPLRRRRGQVWCAVGRGTAAALQAAGIDAVAVPARADSEGVLALPELADLRGRRVGLLTAPGGRDRLAPALQAGGARVSRADVYARTPVPPRASALARLRAHDGPLLLPLSSGEALQRTLAALPADLVDRLRAATVLAASARLAALARETGFADVRRAAGPSPQALLGAWAEPRPGGSGDARAGQARSGQARSRQARSGQARSA